MMRVMSQEPLKSSWLERKPSSGYSLFKKTPQRIEILIRLLDIQQPFYIHTAWIGGFRADVFAAGAGMHKEEIEIRRHWRRVLRLNFNLAVIRGRQLILTLHLGPPLPELAYKLPFIVM